MLEVIKNIGAVASCCIALVAVLTAACKPFKNWLVNLVKTESNSNQNAAQMEEIKNLISQQIDDYDGFKETVLADLSLQKEFARTQLRNLIKNIFYHHRDVKVLPEYEYKTLMTAYELYHALGGNSFVTKLYEIMMTWDIEADKDNEE